MDRRDLVPYVPRLLLEWGPTAAGPEHRAVDGSMAFVDISGFTAMSERLATLGKEGAEEVTEIIGSIFSRLLGVAYENGGSLLKFGGDALLLFFTGSAHELRAAHAAAGMRRGLREIGRIRTSVGVAGLKMHVGVHSGPFDLFLVGGSFRDLVITGPHATRTVAMESAADAGEIVVSDATAAALPANVLGEHKQSGYLLVRTPKPPLVPSLPAIPDGVDASAFIPPEMRELLSGRVDPEHRRVAVGFVRYSGLDRLVADDPRAAAVQIDELMQTVQSACERNGATYIDNDPEADGGKVLIVTGAPSTSERDGEALARTAREIIDADPPGELRIGVTLGPTFAGPIGPPYRRKYTVMGDTVNLAARLSAHAEHGRVVAMPNVLERSRASFATSALEPFQVKGKRDPIHAVVVGPQRRSDDTTVGTPIVGRREELARLRTRLDEARNGDGAVVEIVGEPGLGKSRLAQEVRALADGFAIVHGIAEQYEQATPYAVTRHIVRRALAIADEAPARDAGEALLAMLHGTAPTLVPWSPLIAVAAGAEVPPTSVVDTLSDEFKPERLRSAVVALLRAACPGATLFVIEDAHWLDGASADLLHEIAITAAGRPWLIVVTRRPGGLTVTADLLTEVIELGPLDAQDAAGVVHALAPGLSLTPVQLARLSDRAGGNPLFLQELALAMRAGEGLDGLPGTVDAVIGARIDHLKASDRLLLRRAAVLGTAFSGDLLRALGDADDDVLDISALSSMPDFVVEEAPDEWRFRHALIRDVAYEALPYRRRAELHRRAGRAIEERAGDAVEGWADALCLHAYRAKDFPRAWRYAATAGHRALEQFAVSEAAEYFRLALDAGKRVDGLPPSELSEIAEALGDAHERLGSYSEAMHAYRTARGMRAASTPRAPLFLKEGILRLRLGHYPQALRWYRRGLDPTSAPASPDDVELGLAYAGVRYYQGRYRECIAWCERMAQAAEILGDRPGLAHAYSLLYLAHTHLGTDDRFRYRDLALPLYEEIGDLTGQANVLNNLGIDAYYEGSWDEALSLYRRSRDVQERTGNVIFVADTDNNIAEILSDQGHLDDARQLFERSLETYRASRYAMGEAFAIGNLGRVAARAGRFAEATQLLQDALSRQRAIGDDRQTAEVVARIAEVCVLEGRPDEALTHIEPTLALVERIGDQPALRAMLLRSKAYALAQRGDLADARTAIDRSEEVARTAGVLFELGLSLDASATISEADGDEVTAAGRRAEAAEISRRLGVVRTPPVPIRAAEASGSK